MALKPSSLGPATLELCLERAGRLNPIEQNAENKRDPNRIGAFVPFEDVPTTAAPTAATDARVPHATERVADWCRDAARWLQIGRRLGRTAADAQVLREELARRLPAIVEESGSLCLDVTPRSLVLDDVPVFVADHSNDPSVAGGLERELSWVLHRDGVRQVHFHHGLTSEAARTFLDAIATAAPACATHEDLVTLLWDAAPANVECETEEASALRTLPPAICAQLGSSAHLNDWPLLEAPADDLHLLWLELTRNEPQHAFAFTQQWRCEHEQSFVERSAVFVREQCARDPRPETATALAASLVTWLATATQSGDWAEAREALSLIERVDPERRHVTPALHHAFSGLDAAAITERLDSDPHLSQAQAFALAVRIGAPALPLLVGILAQSGRTRVRAGATTALAFAFADDPSPLAALLAEPNWQVVRDTVFVLGQIGGPAVVPLLAQAGRHVDARVRRAAVDALGQVPAAQARPVLLSQLDSQDLRSLRSALAMLARDPDTRTAEAVVARVLAPEFAARPEEHRLALIAALPDLAGDAAVNALAQTLRHGGWFARPTAERTAAANALRQLGTPAACAVLEQGSRHRAGAVRDACEQVMHEADGA